MAAPGFVSFLMAPLLDWRFERRTYAIALAILSAITSFGEANIEQRLMSALQSNS